MKKSAIRRIFSPGESPSGIPRFPSPDELIKFGQEHFANDFPNPSRHGCPPAEVIFDSIHKGEMASEQLGHLFTCSPCFRDYRSALLKQKSSEPVVVPSKWSWKLEVIRQRPVPVLVGLIVFLIVSGVGIFIGLRNHTVPTLPLADRNPAAPATSHPDVQEPASQPPGPNTKTEPLEIARGESPATANKSWPRDLVASNKVDIDLESYRLSRNAGQIESPPIVLIAGPNQIAIKLPLGSPEGPYKVTLNDPFGNPIRPDVMRAYDGSLLHLEMNLNSVKPGNYLICITRNAEVPDCVPAIVKAR